MKRCFAWILAFTMLALPALALGDIQKDETIYTLLTQSGDARLVLAVSHIDTPESGDYVDYGAYAELSAMVSSAQPVIDGDSITWTLPTDPEGFYSVGTLESPELPFLFSIDYTLDGEPVKPEDLAGRSGRVEMRLKAVSNEHADSLFQTKYMAQIQIPLSLASCSNIDAQGATSTVVGSEQTLTYTVMPGQDADFTLAFDALDFEMGSITIACAPMDIEGMLGLDIQALLEQFGQLSEGASQLYGGAAQLADGMTALSGGLQTLAAESKALPEGAAQLESGMSQLILMLGSVPGTTSTLSEGVKAVHENAKTYQDAVKSLMEESGQLADTAGALAQSGDTLLSALSTLEETLLALAPDLPEEEKDVLLKELSALKENAQAFVNDVEAVKAQSAALLSDETISQLTESGDELISGLSVQSQSTASLATMFKVFSLQTKDLPDSLSQFTEGTSQISGAIEQMADSVSALPEQTAALAEGLGEFAQGLDTAVGYFQEMPMLQGGGEEMRSFVSPSHSARSVQFVYMTDAIQKPREQAEKVSKADEPQTFWARLSALFQ